jgi:hypothetical protein
MFPHTDLGRDGMRANFFENRVLSSIFGSKREEDGFWRKLRNYELHNLYSSPNIVKLIKSRKMRWAGHVSCKDGKLFTGFCLRG